MKYRCVPGSHSSAQSVLHRLVISSLLLLLLVAPVAFAQSTQTLQYTIARPDPWDPQAYSYYTVGVIHTYNPYKRGGTGVFFVQAAGHTAHFFDPLAAAVVMAPNKIRDAYAINLPGHGSSGWPEGRIYSEIS